MTVELTTTTYVAERWWSDVCRRNDLLDGNGVEVSCRTVEIDRDVTVNSVAKHHAMSILSASAASSEEQRTHSATDIVVELTSVFTPADQLKDIKINLAGTNIQRVTSCKYLGVLIDEELKWVENIEYIHNKIIKYIGIFYCKIFFRLQFYVVFILPLYILTCCMELRSMVMQVLHN